MAFSLIIAHPVLSVCALLLASYLTSVVLTVLKPGLRNIPGPLLAKFTGLWKANMSFQGQAHVVAGKLHEKYGNIVRVGPNHVSVSDPTAFPRIYGIRDEFIKVSERLHLYERNCTEYEAKRLHQTTQRQKLWIERNKKLTQLPERLVSPIQPYCEWETFIQCFYYTSRRRA